MKKTIVGIVLFALGFIGQMTFVIMATRYGTSNNILSFNESMVNRLVDSYKLYFEYNFSIALIIIGALLLLIEPTTILVKKINQR